MTKELLEYFNGDELAASVWLSKYAKRDKEGTIIEDTPDDMHKRLAKEFWRIEEKFIKNPVYKKGFLNKFKSKPKFSPYWYKRQNLSEERIYSLFKNYKYVVPAGSVMAGLGSDKPVSLSNCFVLPSPEDSYSSINLTRLYQTELMKRRGGVGYDLSNLRPRGAAVNNAAVTSTGAASFMDVCSDVTNEVAQQGRRGALMISMGLVPDIQEFIEKKQDLTKVTGANVSVQLSDDFMEAVEKDEDYILKWPYNDEIVIFRVDTPNSKFEEMEYGKLYKMWYLKNKFMSRTEKTHGYCKKVKAKELWQQIIHCAWNTAEPGIIFKDRMHNYSPDGIYPKYKGVATNPCVTGDTMVAVADGRGYVSFKDLAEEGKDVPVYSINNNGELVVSKMIHPRISGYNQDIYKITLENGHSLKCTGNHKILTNNRGYVEAKNLTKNDSLALMTKSELTWDERYHKVTNKKHQPYNFIFLSGYNKVNSEHKLIYEYYNPEDKNFQVIHHIDFNGLNNNPENLKGMSRKDHIDYHKIKMFGENNPMVKIKNDPERLKEYSKHMSNATLGEKNGRCKITIKQYKQLAIEFAKNLNRNFYLQEWLKYCESINYPKNWDKFLQRTFGTSKNFIKLIAKEANVPYISCKGKILQKYLRAKENGYNVFIDKDETNVFIERTCEQCGKKFIQPWDIREHSFCSQACVCKWIANNSDSYKVSRKKYGKIAASVYYERNKKIIEYYINHNNINTFNELKKNFFNDTGIKYDSRAKLAYKKFDDIKSAAITYNHKVLSIEYIGKDTVYNGTVENWHNYFTGKFEEKNEFGRSKYLSINQLNCGEIYMSGNESCRLLSLNLLSFVDNQFTENAEIDFELLYNITYEAMRIGDDLVELENEAVQKIIDEVKDDEFALRVWNGVLEKSKNGRRVGLGFTALSDMIAAINLKFCTEEANEIVKQVCQTMNKAVLDCQSDMAIERGRFPDQSIGLEIVDANDWYDYIHKNYYEQYMRIMTYGRRNIASTSIAPAGTISTQTRTSSGIEPVFMPYYTRRKKCVTPEDRVDYTDKLGINFTEFVIVHPQLQKWAEINMKDYMDSFTHLSEKEWEEIYKKSPWFGACAQDIDWQKRVELQGIVQRELIQHSISSTCNLPNDVTEEEVSNIYMTAWKEGLKGITVYRDGCREGILVKKEEKKEEAKFFNNIDAPKRPKSLPADFYVTTVKGDKFFVIVGLYEEKPYEVFIYKVKEGEKTNYNQHRGIITKVKRGYYTYKSDELVIENISSDLTSEEYALALMSSMLMRHGANIKFICKTVEKIDDNISSFSSAMRRILMKYIKDQIIEGEKCPECGGKLARENGCIHCLDCGWSKCG